MPDKGVAYGILFTVNIYQHKNSSTQTFTPVPGPHVHRLESNSRGWLGTGKEEANNLCKNMYLFPFSVPNGLFWCTQRDKAFIPIEPRDDVFEDSIVITLALNEIDNEDHLARFFSDWIGCVSDFPEATNRLRKVSELFMDDIAHGLLRVIWKKVS